MQKNAPATSANTSVTLATNVLTQIAQKQTVLTNVLVTSVKTNATIVANVQTMLVQMTLAKQNVLANH